MGVVRLTLSLGEVAGADGAVVGVAALEGTYTKGHMMCITCNAYKIQKFNRDHVRFECMHKMSKSYKS